MQFKWFVSVLFAFSLALYPTASRSGICLPENPVPADCWDDYDGCMTTAEHITEVGDWICGAVAVFDADRGSQCDAVNQKNFQSMKNECIGDLVDCWMRSGNCL